MTHDTKRARRLAPLPVAALAALLLAGCSTGHIGESWQCPLAEGGLCDSVAAADPAVPDPKTAGPTVLAEPLWRVRAGETDAPAPPPCAAECGSGFDPFAWLARLFQGEATETEARPAEPAPAPLPAGPETADGDAPAEATETLAAPGSREPVPAPAPDNDPGSEPGEQAPGLSQDGPARDGRADGDLDGDDLRTGEILARIWIAPFVDADGVYREASHVRVVLEPAGWRLP